MKNKLGIFALLMILGRMAGNPQIIMSPPPALVLWNDAEILWDDPEVDMEEAPLVAAIPVEPPVQHDWAQAVDLHALPSSIPTTYLQKFARICERNIHFSQCCKRMNREPRGQCNWYYPCCFCVYDQGMEHPINHITICKPLTGENGIIFPDCCLRHTCYWHNGICLNTDAPGRVAYRNACLCSLECCIIGWLARGF